MTSAAAESEAMIKLPKLSIAAVNGMAIGGGVNLALVWQDFVPGLWLSNSLGLAPNVFSLHLSSELRSTSARTAHRFGISRKVAWRCDTSKNGWLDQRMRAFLAFCLVCGPKDAVFRYPFGELGLTPELGSSVLLLLCYMRLSEN